MLTDKFDVSKEEIEKLKKKDMLETLLQEMAQDYPTLSQVVVIAGLFGLILVRVGLPKMGQWGKMGLLFKLFIKKDVSCINKRLWSQ